MDAQIKNELISLCETYFKSIESLFKYREKHIWKYNTISFVYRTTRLIYFAFIFIPIFPYGGADFIASLIGKSIIVKNYIIPMDNFFIRWLLLNLVVLPILLISYLIRKNLSKKNEKYSISPKQLDFAYIASCIDELKIFLINDRNNSIHFALNYLQKYYQNSDAFIVITGEADTSRQFLPDTLTKLKEERFWFGYDEKTSKVIKAFNDFDLKIFLRIEQKDDIDKVVDWLNYLLIYEFTKIKRIKTDELSFTSLTINEIGHSSFFEFCECINNAQELEEIKEKEESKFSLINKINLFFSNISHFFAHKNPIITFFSWLILLGIIFMSVIYSGVQIFHLKINDTIFIGSLSATLVCTITITATVYSKKNN